MDRWLLRGTLMFSLVAFFTFTAVEARADGAELYEANCAKCHGSSGKADTGMGRRLGVPSFEGESFGVEQIDRLLRESSSHARLKIELDAAELESLVATLNELASSP